jgi:hypothetical protein
MRSSRRKRPLLRIIAPSPAGINLERVAGQALYVGSPEHKDTPSFAGHPRPRSDASICDRGLAQEQAEVTRWLRGAIERGHVSAYWEGEFPRYVWYKRGDTVYEGRLVNRETGWYKGYPLEVDEGPEGIEIWDE